VNCHCRRPLKVFWCVKNAHGLHVSIVRLIGSTLNLVLFFHPCGTSPIHNLDGIYISSILVIEKMGMNKQHWIAQIWSSEQTKVFVNKKRS
jgi:hypothetical protein